MRYYFSSESNCSAFAAGQPGSPQYGYRPGALVTYAGCAGDALRHPSGVLGSARNSVQQQRPAGNRLAMMLGIGQAGEQASPVAGQAHQCRAARETLKRFPYIVRSSLLIETAPSGTTIESGLAKSGP
jgi:hypothetical protein